MSSVQRELNPFICVLNLLGLVPHPAIGIADKVPKRFLRIYFFVIFCLSQCFSCFVFVYSSLHPEDFALRVYNNTGNIYLRVELAFTCILISWIYIYFRAMQSHCLKLLEFIVQHQSATAEDDQGPVYCCKLSRLFLLYVLLSVTSGINFFYALKSSGLKLISFICCLIVYTTIFVLCAFVVMLFACFCRILEAYMKAINNSLCTATIRTDNAFKQLMSRRQLLLQVCATHMSQHYGCLLLAVIAYMIVATVTGPFYLITVIFEFKHQRLYEILRSNFVATYWSLPWYIVFTVLMRSSHNMVQEVNGRVFLLFKSLKSCIL